MDQKSKELIAGILEDLTSGPQEPKEKARRGFNQLAFLVTEHNGDIEILRQKLPTVIEAVKHARLSGYEILPSEEISQYPLEPLMDLYGQLYQILKNSGLITIDIEPFGHGFFKYS